MKISRALPIVLVLLFAALHGSGPIVAASSGRGAGSEAAELPGFVDGSAFSELAGDDGEVVEVNLGPSLLGALARGASKDPDASSVLSGLRSVTAYILDLKKDADRTAKAARLVQDMEGKLQRGGWERLARVRDKSERVDVFALTPNKTIEGLVVLVINMEDGEVVFANLAGTIDLAKIGDMENTLHVPGLDKVGKSREAGGALDPGTDGKGAKHPSGKDGTDEGGEGRGESGQDSGGEGE
jgi:hypothetical protein